MYFKKLEIAGFKSFAAKTTLHFESGITAIVGPNGCGKSNVFDSIRWCLGEQSVKSLRGTKMEDVIFNGTETIPAQHFAEVSLTISNEAKLLPIDYEEITITRRLLRSGESEYLINNSRVRCKDINELLMGTGIGAESYSLVEQGKIDLVISSKPEDRRLVFDEATGISRYKTKKKEAMNKLEDVDNNLLRVEDIITEVKRQISSIERQANKTRRYKEIFEKLKDAELKFSNHELKKLKSDSKMISQMAKKTCDEELAINKQLESLDEKLILQQKDLQELDAKHSRLKNEISALENANDRNRQHINLNHDRIIDLNQHADMLSIRKDQLKEKISNHQKAISELQGGLLNLKDISTRKESRLKDRQKSLAALLDEIDALQAQTKALKERIFEINLTETQINNQMNENSSRIHTLSSRLRRLETEKIKTEEEGSQLTQSLQGVNNEISLQKNQLGVLEVRLHALKKQKTHLEDALNECDEKLRGLENEKLGLRSQAEFLKELKLKYDSMPEAKNGVFEVNELPEEKITGIIARAREVKFDESAKTYRVQCEIKFISFDLETLYGRIEEITKEIEGLQMDKAEKEKSLKSLSKESQIVNDDLQKEKLNLANKETIFANLSENTKKIHEELALITFELSEVTEELGTSRQKDDTFKNEASSIKSEIQEAQMKISENAQAVNDDIASKEKILVEIARLKTELDNQNSKEEALRANLNFFNAAVEEDNSAFTLNDKEIQQAHSKIHELHKEITALEIQITGNDEEINVKTKEDHRFSSIRIENINSLDFTQKQIIDLEEQADKIKDESHRYQMQEQEFNFKFAGIKNKILQSYNVDLDDVPLTEVPLEGPQIQELAGEITSLKDKVASFGTVNLVAIEEMEELKNRYDFLTRQQNDLIQAKESLQKAIVKINRTTRKMFLETFQIVTEEFKNYFKRLFGGGEARLFLIDEEDVLESGIEIICRPPGKKLQNITLLSGGEKALSAIALIFAIFKTKPSPFCVLDEIDAALDESNIDRFSSMLGEFSKTSQFIVITHNKKTISWANTMYGITMEHSGMSKIVSVKLNDANQTPAESQSLEPSSPAGRL